MFFDIKMRTLRCIAGKLKTKSEQLQNYILQIQRTEIKRYKQKITYNKQYSLFDLKSYINIQKIVYFENFFKLQKKKKKISWKNILMIQ